MAIRVDEAHGLATSLQYYTTPWRRELVAAVADALGLKVADE